MKKTTKNTHVGFIQSVKNYWMGYINFSGTASRREYWFAWLFIMLLECLVMTISVFFIFGNILGTILSAITFLPSRALAFRRLHDVGISGLWYLIPYMILIPWLLIRSTTWAILTELNYVPWDMPVCLLLLTVATIAYFIVLVQPSKLKNNPYRK